jgi:hypothetical protein
MCGQALEALQPLWREFDVKRAWLFGGRARGEADAGRRSWQLCGCVLWSCWLLWAGWSLRHVHLV